MTTRAYRVKDVEMLLAAKTITQALSANLAELATVRSNWTQDYIDQLTAKIEDALQNHLGLDKKKDLRQATNTLLHIQQPALRDLAFLKTQIEVDFGPQAQEITKTLGYDQYLYDARKANQEALIQLLYTFKQNMDESLKNQIVQKGTNPTLIQNIIGYADTLKQANTTQETLKETTKERSEHTLTLFNEIYQQIIGICKIAASFYRNNPLKKEQFTFSKIVANMNTTPKHPLGAREHQSPTQTEKHLPHTERQFP